MEQQNSTILQVAAKAAILSPDGKVLILREAATGKNNTKVGYWGLIGGRLEPGETFEAALTREILEETGLTVRVGKPLYVGEWHPVIRDVPHQIIAIFMECYSDTVDVRLSSEHDEFAWIKPADRSSYDMMEPDCFVVDALVSKS